MRFFSFILWPMLRKPPHGTQWFKRLSSRCISYRGWGWSTEYNIFIFALLYFHSHLNQRSIDLFSLSLSFIFFYTYISEYILSGSYICVFSVNNACARKDIVYVKCMNYSIQVYFHCVLFLPLTHLQTISPCPKFSQAWLCFCW